MKICYFSYSSIKDGFECLAVYGGGTRIKSLYPFQIIWNMHVFARIVDSLKFIPAIGVNLCYPIQ